MPNEVELNRIQKFNKFDKFSEFILRSKDERKGIRIEKPDLANAKISKMLGQFQKDVPEDKKK